MRVTATKVQGAIGVMMCALLCAAWISPARAAGLNALLACRKVAARDARLACFDRESATLARVPSVTAAHADVRSVATPAAASAPPLNPQQTFGLPPMQVVEREQAAEHLPRQLARLNAHIAAVGRAGDGRQIFTLDNDQVWAQLEPDENLSAKAGDAVTISRGWLSSYWLSLRSREGCKVTRLR